MPYPDKHQTPSALDDVLTPIQDIKDAEIEAHVWAGEFDADSLKAIKFAREWFEDSEESYRTRFHLRWMLRAFDRYRQQQETASLHLRSLILQEATQWNLEIVKHLAALNGAGFAGSAALLASKFGDALAIRASLPVFAAGLILAVLNFFLNTRGHIGRLTITQGRIDTILEAATWADLKKPVESTQGLTPNDWHDCAERVGWLSAILALVGAVLIGISLFSSSSA